MTDQRVVSVPSKRSIGAHKHGHETIINGYCGDDYFQMSFEKRSDGRMHIHFYGLTDGARIVAPASALKTKEQDSPRVKAIVARQEQRMEGDAHAPMPPDDLLALIADWRAR
jgi:hypothetical protein